MIYNIAGQAIRSIDPETLDAGEHEFSWDGRNAAGVNVASGVYIYRLKTKEFVQAKKMLLLR